MVKVTTDQMGWCCGKDDKLEGEALCKDGSRAMVDEAVVFR